MGNKTGGGSAGSGTPGGINWRGGLSARSDYGTGGMQAPFKATTPVAGSGDMKMVKELAGVLVGASLAGMFMEPGTSFVDIATSMNGALGAVVGYAAVPYILKQVTKGKKSIPYPGLIGAIAVPALIAMEIDSTVIGLGVGGFAGAYAADMIMSKSAL